MAAEDLKEKTAILDARFLGGDEKLYAQLDKVLISDVLNRSQQAFFKAKLEESRKRHKQYGESIYLLEPQLKEGEGGLRDLHTALWLAKVKYKVHSLEELVQKAVITEPELNEVNAAQDFLLRVRNSLHFLSGRHFDQLTFEYQEQIAPMLGFTESGGNQASANLMRTYYQQASTILSFSEGLIARVTEDTTSGAFLAAPDRAANSSGRGDPGQRARHRHATIFFSASRSTSLRFSPIARATASNCRAAPTNWCATIWS